MLLVGEYAGSLHVCNTACAFSSAETFSTPVYSWDAGLDWSPVNTRTVHLSLPPNHAATGKPTVSGPTMVGGTLTAVTSGIADTDCRSAPLRSAPPPIRLGGEPVNALTFELD